MIGLLAMLRAGVRRPRAAGFTLIELMVVVGIIGMLSALAIPSFVRFQMRTKAAEGKVNLAAIAKAENAYFSEFATYVAVPAGVPVPAPVPGRTAWVPGSPFDALGFAPEGDVYFTYAVAADNNGAGAALVRFTAEAASDIDGDGLTNHWGYVKPAAGAASGLGGVLPGTTCVGTGTWDSTVAAATQLETVGPCDAISGTSEY